MHGGAQPKQLVLVNRERLKCGPGSKLLDLIVPPGDSESRKVNAKDMARANRAWMIMKVEGRVQIRGRGRLKELLTSPPRFDFKVVFGCSFSSFLVSAVWLFCPVMSLVSDVSCGAQKLCCLI